MTVVAKIRRALWVSLLVILACTLAGIGSATAQEFSINLGAAGEGGSYTGRLIQLFLLMTILSLAPGILVMATSFVRIVVVFSLLRSAIGLQQSPPNMVMVSLALFLTGFIMAPTMNKAWHDGVAPMMAEEINPAEGVMRAASPFQAFMVRQVDAEDLAFFEDLALRQQVTDDVEALEHEDPSSEERQNEEAVDLPPLHILLPAFMISELSRAFEIGFLVMMPFLVIDLAIAAILMSMGMMMLPPQVVSLAMKLIFFVLIDGWRLLSESLVQSFF